MYIEYLAILIPIISSLIAFLFFKHKLVWWEMLLPIGICLIMIFAWSTIQRNGMTKDVEIWNDNVIRVEYYEAWDEYIHQTCSRTCCCTTDLKGNQTCGTEYYDCSYVEDHSPYWQAITATGWVISISESDYKTLVKRWGNQSFKDMHRDYHSYDGDKYYSNWNRKIEDSETFSKSHTYQNKTQAAYSNFEFEKIDSLTAAEYKLYEYPDFKNQFDKDYLLGVNSSAFETQLLYSNGTNGPKYQLVNWLLVFKNAPIEAAFHQESYWMGGNKNEAVTCISVDDSGTVHWAKTFSWTEEAVFIYDMERLFEEGKPLKSLLNTETINSINTIARTEWKRKEFSDFDYITIPLPSSSVMWIFIITFIITVGLLIYGIANQFEYDKDGNLIDTTYNRYRRRY